MIENKIRSIVIVGGGTAGWMTAAAASKLLKNNYCSIRLVESDAIGIVGVGEATIPQIQLFNKVLDLQEDDFIKKTQATFKLGIEFINWRKLGHSYVHPFGSFGINMMGVEFHHFWLKLLQQKGVGAVPEIEDYSISAVAAKQGRFMRPINVANSPLSDIHYAFHLDAGLYGKYLRSFAEERGVVRTEGKVTRVIQRENDGFIKSIVLEDGSEIEGDLFIDCSGFRGLLIEETLKTGYESWLDYLPCDTAVAIPSEKVAAPIPYTKSTAHTAGWQWRIPLQHRTGNGHVFSSQYMSEDEATAILLKNLDGAPLADPRTIKFKVGKRKKYWNKNCIAIGLSSGFIEPLESTAIHLIQSNIARLFSLFPTRDFNQAEVDMFNRMASLEMDRVRDFIILHYVATERDDSAFWNYCRNMHIPEYLARKLEMYKCSGRIFREDEELFNETSWLAVMHGQGIEARGYHPIVDTISQEELEARVSDVESVISRSSKEMPAHQVFIDQHCLAEKVNM